MAGAAARTGEAMVGRAVVATRRPAWGTTAATLLNMVQVAGGVSRCLECVSRWLSMEWWRYARVVVGELEGEVGDGDARCEKTAVMGRALL